MNSASVSWRRFWSPGDAFRLRETLVAAFPSLWETPRTSLASWQLYNWSKRSANGKDLTVAHAMWKSSGHKRYERWLLADIMDIPAWRNTCRRSAQRRNRTAQRREVRFLQPSCVWRGSGAASGTRGAAGGAGGRAVVARPPPSVKCSTLLGSPQGRYMYGAVRGRRSWV